MKTQKYIMSLTKRSWYWNNIKSKTTFANPSEYPYLFHSSQNLFKNLSVDNCWNTWCVWNMEFWKPVIYTSQYPSTQYWWINSKFKPNWVDGTTWFWYYLQLLFKSNIIKSDFWNHWLIRLWSDADVKRYIHVIKNEWQFHKTTFDSASSEWLKSFSQTEFISEKNATVIKSIEATNLNSISIPEWITIKWKTGNNLLWTFSLSYFIEMLNQYKEKNQLRRIITSKLTNIINNSHNYLKIPEELKEYTSHLNI